MLVPSPQCGALITYATTHADQAQEAGLGWNQRINRKERRDRKEENPLRSLRSFSAIHELRQAVIAIAAVFRV